MMFFLLIEFNFALQVIPVDKTGNFDMMYSFLKENWRIAKWVALGAVVFEVKKEIAKPLECWM
jgi:hypothetical protein